ncbi:hypothetical protein ACE6H2_000418 [Prunus campanulata]
MLPFSNNLFKSFLDNDGEVGSTIPMTLSRAEPELHNLGDDIKNDALMSKCTTVGRMVCGMEIDFRKVFDMILQVAVDGNLRPDQMDKRVFVLTRLENFDRAGGSCFFLVVRETSLKGKQPKLVVVAGSWIMRHYKKISRRKARVMQCHILCFGILTPTRRCPCLVVGDHWWP